MSEPVAVCLRWCTAGGDRNGWTGFSRGTGENCYHQGAWTICQSLECWAGFYGTKVDWLMRHRGSNQTCERNQGPRPETHEPQRQTETQGQPADNVKLLANKQSACFQTCQDMLFLWCENCEFCCLQLVRSLWETNNPLCVLAACISVSLQRHNRPNISCVTCCVTVRCASRYNTGVLPWIA